MILGSLGLTAVQFDVPLEAFEVLRFDGTKYLTI